MSVLHSLAAGYELGSGRLVPTVAALVGLASVVIGWWALRRRAANAGTGALALGLVSTVVGGLHGANAAGGLGTGNGLAGAIFAVVLGVAGMVAGGLAVARSRRRYAR